MSKPAGRSNDHDVMVLVGTTKGAFVFRANSQRKTWRRDGPYFRGEAVYATSDDFGKTWSGPEGSRIKFPDESTLADGLPQTNAYETVLRDSLTADSSTPAGIYFGTRTGKVFASNDNGDGWTEIADSLPPVVCVKAFTLSHP